MNSHISSKTSTFSAPVVQSRLEHHHQQQLKHPEVRHQHQRSKSLNKGKRHNYNNYHQKTKETTTFTSSSTSTTTTEVARNNNKNFSNFNNNFDFSYYRDNNLVENGKKTSTSNRPSRRHQHSDSVDEDKFRVTPTISILKRPQSATDFVKTSSNSKSTFSLDVTQEEQGFNVNNNHRSNNKVGEKSPPQQRRSQSKERRRSDATPSKSKRSQRTEVKSMEFETDLMFNVNSSQPSTTTTTTIQQLSGSGDESDVNSNNNQYMKPVSNVIFPPLNYSNAILALEEGMMNSNKKEDIFHSDDNATVKRVNKKRSDESTPRRLSSTAIELQSQVFRFADSDSILFPKSILSSTPPSAHKPSSSPSRLGGGPKLYAGPTFHNSPAPSDLPMPSFYGKSLGKDPSPLSVGGNNLFTVPENVPSPSPNVHSNYDAYSSPSSGNTSDDDIFAMDDFEPPKVPYYPESPALRKQQSQELLHILATNTRQHPTAASYMVPERMATAHHPMQVYPANGLNLNEISETLRSLLKIHGQ